MRPVARLLAGARDSRLCVDHDLACQQSGFGQGFERKQRGGGVAARVRNELRCPDLRVIALCEAVYRLQGAQLRRRIPFLACSRVAQPERAGQVYDADGAADETGAIVAAAPAAPENDVGLVGQLRRNGSMTPSQIRARPAACARVRPATTTSLP
jgi:hypothetical protein